MPRQTRLRLRDGRLTGEPLKTKTFAWHLRSGLSDVRREPALKNAALYHFAKEAAANRERLGEEVGELRVIDASGETHKISKSDIHKFEISEMNDKPGSPVTIRLDVEADG